MALSSVSTATATMGTDVSNKSQNVQVKQESAEDVEIAQLATKIREAHKAAHKASSTQQQMGATNSMASSMGGRSASTSAMNMVRPGQPSIQNYMHKNNEASQENEKVQECIDLESQKGRFGWVTLGEIHVPFLYRKSEKYCVVRLVENKVLSKFLNQLSTDIFGCTCIRSYYITDAEARLLNEINVRHSDGQFGRDSFTTRDLVVRVEDSMEFYKFLDLCYKKLTLRQTDGPQRCGFMKINNESVVPYTVCDNGIKYVPLFYFEGEVDNLKLKAKKIEGWDLAYLKFCCKVQGIRNELFSSEMCLVISLDDIRAYFPVGTLFDEYWPGKMIESQLLLPTARNSTTVVQGQWARPKQTPPPLPAGPPPVLPPPPPGPAPKTPVAANPVASLANVVNSMPSRTTNPISRASVVTHIPAGHTTQVVSSNVSHMGNSNVNNYNGWPRHVPGNQQMAVRNNSGYQTGVSTIGQVAGIGSTGVSPTPGPVPGNPRMGQTLPSPSTGSLASTTSEMASVASVGPPPPLVRGHPNGQGMLPQANSVLMTNPYMMSQMNTTTAPRGHENISSTSATHNTHPAHYTSVHGQQSSTVHREKQPPPPLISINGKTSRPMDLSSNYPMTVPGGSATSGLVHIPDQQQASGAHAPFRVQKALVHGLMVPCINSKPYSTIEMLMTLPDLVANFFPQLSVDKCQTMLQQGLGIMLFRANRNQIEVLHAARKCGPNDVVPLVAVRDILQYMPQLKYIVSGISASEAVESQSKRPRIL